MKLQQAWATQNQGENPPPSKIILAYVNKKYEKTGRISYLLRIVTKVNKEREEAKNYLTCLIHEISRIIDQEN